MKGRVVACILFVCILGVAAGRIRVPATVHASVRESLPGQSPNDILPQGGVTIVAPSDQYAWRVSPGGKIEFSFDSSRTWETQKSGVTTDLTGGWAPSSKVCWVVGKAGTILLTTDRGKHWKKLNSPIPGDVEGVFAQDAKRASVWTPSHKQSFDTNDGGATWAQNNGS
jgi:photosystem II stability/assembly factor-like uncharacterized protein